MRKRSLFALLISVATGASGCEVSLTEPERTPPNITGNWVVSITEAGPRWNHPDPSAGVCTIGTFQLTLSGPEKVVESFHYSGSHAAINIVCAGVTEPATEVFGLADTVVVIPPGAVHGEATYLGCIGLQGCGDSSGWLFSMDFSGFGFIGGTLSATHLEGGFEWRGNLGDPRVSGLFEAGR